MLRCRSLVVAAAGSHVAARLTHRLGPAAGSHVATRSVISHPAKYIVIETGRTGLRRHVGFGEFVKQLITRRSIVRLRHSFALKRSISLWAYDVGASAHIRICVNIIRLTAALSHHELIGGQTVEQRAFLGVSAFLTVKPDAVNKLLGAVWPATWAAPSPTASAVTVITNAARKPALATP